MKTAQLFQQAAETRQTQSLKQIAQYQAVYIQDVVKLVVFSGQKPVQMPKLNKKVGFLKVSGKDVLIRKGFVKHFFPRLFSWRKKAFFRSLKGLSGKSSERSVVKNGSI